MEETDLLDALDRRAQRAVEALDSALAGTPAPPLPTASVRRRPWLPLLVAAGLVIVALVGAGLILTGTDDEQGTVADDRDAPVETVGDITRLALPDPAVLGYEVRAAFDGPSVPVDPESPAPPPSLAAHGPTDDDDPWRRAIVTQPTPWDDQVYTGEVIDLGRVEGMYRSSWPLDQIAWQDGDEARTLMTSRIDRDALVEVAREAAQAGWDGEEPLPGHEVLHEGTYDEFSQLVEFGGSWRSGWQGVAYDDTTGDDDAVIAWRRGGPASVRALHVFDGDVETVDVDGHRIWISRATDRGAGHASWTPVDGTVVTLATYGDIEAMLRQIVPALVPIDAEEFAAMVADHPTAAAGLLLERSEADFPIAGEGPVIASAELPERSGHQYRVSIIEEPSGHALMQEVTEGNGTSSSGGPLPDLTTPQLQAGGYSMEQDGTRTSTPVVVSGVLPAGVDADLRSARYVDRTTGAAIGVLDAATASIPGSPHLLGLVLLDADPETTRVDVTFQTADGERTWRL